MKFSKVLHSVAGFITHWWLRITNQVSADYRINKTTNRPSIYVHVGKHFSYCPKTKSEGRAFREQFLEKPISMGYCVTVDFTGLVVTNVSEPFLNEAFGVLAHNLQLSHQELEESLIIRSLGNSRLIFDIDGILRANCKKDFVYPHNVLRYQVVNGVLYYQLTNVSIAEDFSKHLKDRSGEFGGAQFRMKFLEGPISKGIPVLVDFTGVRGYSSSFLEEAFGGLARYLCMPYDELRSKLILNSPDDPSIIEEIEEYLEYNCKK